MQHFKGKSFTGRSLTSGDCTGAREVYTLAHRAIFSYRLFMSPQANNIPRVCRLFPYLDCIFGAVNVSGACREAVPGVFLVLCPELATHKPGAACW